MFFLPTRKASQLNNNPELLGVLNLNYVLIFTSNGGDWDQSVLVLIFYVVVQGDLYLEYREKYIYE
tara:strand:- start:389 stop:586 length:198 start_codon:yes stop_codon:yes gene_type:complete